MPWATLAHRQCPEFRRAEPTLLSGPTSLPWAPCLYKQTEGADGPRTRCPVYIYSCSLEALREQMAGVQPSGTPRSHLPVSALRVDLGPPVPPASHGPSAIAQGDRHTS